MAVTMTVTIPAVPHDGFRLAGGKAGAGKGGQGLETGARGIHAGKAERDRAGPDHQVRNDDDQEGRQQQVQSTHI